MTFALAKTTKVVALYPSPFLFVEGTPSCSRFVPFNSPYITVVGRPLGIETIKLTFRNRCSLGQYSYDFLDQDLGGSSLLVSSDLDIGHMRLREMSAF